MISYKPDALSVGHKQPLVATFNLSSDPDAGVIMGYHFRRKPAAVVFEADLYPVANGKPVYQTFNHFLCVGSRLWQLQSPAERQFDEGTLQLCHVPDLVLIHRPAHRSMDRLLLHAMQ